MSESLPYQSHSETSRQAADDFAPFAKTKRYQVYRYIRDHPFVTDKDVQKNLNMNPSTQRPRRIELEYAGLIQHVGDTQPPGPMNLYKITGKPYPRHSKKGLWAAEPIGTRNKQGMPCPQDMAIAVKFLRDNYRKLPPLPEEVIQVLRWMAQYSTTENEIK